MRFSLFQDFFSLLFPRTCCVCKRSLFEFENLLCKVCISKLPVTTYHLRPQKNELKTKLLGLTEVSMVMAFLRFSKKGISQSILHQLKYRNRPELGNIMGRLYAHVLIASDYQGHWDAVVPIPLHPVKYKRRGYNQSQRFAEGLTEVLQISLSDALVRKKNTESQTRKSRIERWQNVQEVFGLDPDTDIRGKKVLLVDDVITTGATLAAASNTLRENGAVTIDIAVIAAGK